MLQALPSARITSVGLAVWFGFWEGAGPLLAQQGKDEAISPVLARNEEVLKRLKDLKSNRAVLLGKAQVTGEFNDVARQYNLHTTGPMGRDFTIKMAWAPDRKRVL